MGRPKSPAVATRDAEIYARWTAGERNLTALAKDYGITPQRAGQVVAAKEHEIYTAWRTGKYTLGDLAERYELTPEDISGIVAAKHPEQDEGVSRAVLRSRLELLSLAVQEVIESPGWKLTPNGHLAEDEYGNPLVDTGARIEAIKVQVSVFKNLAVLNGDEKQAMKAMDKPTAEQAMWAALAVKRAEKEMSDADRRELEELRRQVGRVVPGEVVRPAIEG